MIKKNYHLKKHKITTRLSLSKSSALLAKKLLELTTVYKYGQMKAPFDLFMKQNEYFSIDVK